MLERVEEALRIRDGATKQRCFLFVLFTVVMYSLKPGKAVTLLSRVYVLLDLIKKFPALEFVVL